MKVVKQVLIKKIEVHRITKMQIISVWMLNGSIQNNQHKPDIRKRNFKE